MSHPVKTADRISLNNSSSKQTFCEKNGFDDLENDHKTKVLDKDLTLYDPAILEDELTRENDASNQSESNQNECKSYNQHHIEPRIFIRYSHTPDSVPVELIHDQDYEPVRH